MTLGFVRQNAERRYQEGIEIATCEELSLSGAAQAIDNSDARAA